MSEEEEVALIDRFIEGTLSSAEADVVRQRIESDEEFAALYRDMKYLVASTSSAGRKELADYLSKAEAPKSTQWYWISGIAATLVLVVSIAVYTNRNEGDASVHVALVQEYFVPYPNVIAPVVRGVAEDSSQRATALRHYELAEYGEALEALKHVDMPSSDDLFYMGVSALALHDYSAASAYLKDYESKGESFADQAKWYLALAFLGNDDVESARTYLGAIAKSESSYAKQAQELLTRIDK
jgi:NTP pyrophosphatase (non-canonical NTP hydrolase)